MLGLRTTYDIRRLVFESAGQDGTSSAGGGIAAISAAMPRARPREECSSPGARRPLRERPLPSARPASEPAPHRATCTASVWRRGGLFALAAAKAGAALDERPRGHLATVAADRDGPPTGGGEKRPRTWR
ncbi:hypothetical protein [Gaiella occulta]|uniref:hypothetical protein n=1 Tax=Gaiella occulta TaxID=1002870 RepID=UPI0011C07F8D|nr:hypothetical protein [Gaiella occulta]